MKAVKEQALGVRCPTCGARPKEKCELCTGLPRTDPHPARSLAAEKEWRRRNDASATEGVRLIRRASEARETSQITRF